jgi:hypothetical protein
MRFWGTIILAVALAAGAPSARAQNPSAQSSEAARDLLKVLFDQAFSTLNAQAVESAWPGIETAVRAQNPNVDVAALAELRREFARIRLAQLHEVTRDLPMIYARLLTAEEMRDIAAFYRTRSGMKMLHVLPQIMAEGFATTLPRMQSLSSDTNAAFLALLRERGLL